MNPLGSNNLATFASIGRGLTQLAGAVRDLFQGAYTTMARWVAGAPAQASVATQIEQRKGVQVAAETDPRAGRLARRDFVLPGTGASIPSSQADATIDADSVAWRTEPAGRGATDSPPGADRSHGSAHTLKNPVQAVAAWCESTKPSEGANAGNLLFRSKDSPADAITAAMAPFATVMLSKADQITDEVVVLRSQHPHRSDDDLLLEVTSKHLVEGAENPLRELVPDEQQTMLRSIRNVVEGWHQKSADKVFSSSLFLRCASPEIEKAARGPKGELMRKLSKLLPTLANYTEALAPKMRAQGATPEYLEKFLTASQGFQARIRDLEQG